MSHKCKVYSCGEQGCTSEERDCSDENPCTKNEHCDPEEGCVFEWKCPDPEDLCIERWCNEQGNCDTRVLDCDDDNDCTTEHCEPDVGCVYEWECESNSPCIQEYCIQEGENERCVHVYPCDDRNPCTQDRCIRDGESFYCDYKCLDCNGCDGDICKGCDCVWPHCTVSLDPGMVPECGQVELMLTADCWPNCGSMNIGIAGPPQLIIEQPEAVPCEGPSVQQSITVTASGVPDPNPAVLTITASSPGASCQNTTQVFVIADPVDLDVDSNNDGAIDEADDAIENDPFSPQKPGRWMWVNNDDSNNDNQQDRNNAVIDEAADLKDLVDLAVRRIDPTKVPPGAKLYLETSNNAAIRVFSSKDPGTAVEVIGPGQGAAKEITIVDSDRTFAIEGVDGNQTLTVSLVLKTAGGGDLCRDDLRVTVVKIVKVEWETFGTNTLLDDCPNNNHLDPPPIYKSRRIFPDRQAYVDPGAADRPKVYLKATVKPVVQNYRVYLRSWDVDDPFDQIPHNPLVSLQSEIDNDTRGPDNRVPSGPDGGVVNLAALTDPQGIARLEVVVSTQPGNNYRGGASAMVEGVEDEIVDQADADADNAPPPVKFSDMLTIWRQVWLELDSMGLGTDISYSGSILQVIDDYPHAGDGVARLEGSWIQDEGRFEGGVLDVPAMQHQYELIDVILFVEEEYVNNTLLNPMDIGYPATVTDDDSAVLPRTPDGNIAVLDNKYRNSYVTFREDATTRDNTNIFVATLPKDRQTLVNKAFENDDLLPAPDFWYCIIVTCFQSHHLDDGIWLPFASTRDGDPDAQYHCHQGATCEIGDEQLVMANSYDGVENVCMFYYETNRDYLAQVLAGYWPSHIWRPLTFKEPRTIAHEIAHLFGIGSHTPGTLVDTWDGTDRELDGEQIAQIRGSQHLAAH